MSEAREDEEKVSCTFEITQVCVCVCVTSGC